MFLDQVALQNECLQLRICDDVLKPGDPRDHLFDLRSLVAAALEILAHTVLQAYGFSYIYDLIVLIMHEINSRRCWEFF